MSNDITPEIKPARKRWSRARWRWFLVVSIIPTVFAVTSLAACALFLVEGPTAEFWLPSKYPDVEDMQEASFAARIWGLMAVVGYLGAWLSSLQADKAAAANAKATEEGVS